MKPRTKTKNPAHRVRDRQEVRTVAIVELRESATNPRKHFDKTRLEELTLSIRNDGVIVPLLVRPQPNLGRNETGFEIVAGARRYRAAKAAGLKEVPVLVRQLSELQALETQVVENLQRTDVHPLDEALGYRALIEKARYDVAAIAAKVGKSESYVYQRLKLTDLINRAKAAFLQDKITIGHAILIARLQPKEQKTVLEGCAENENGVVTVRQLRHWIEQEIHLDLHTAPFSRSDAKLLPEAGACKSCPKRTGFVPSLFPDIAKKDTCTDPACYDRKVNAHVQRLKQELTDSRVSFLEISGNYGHERRNEKNGLLSADQYYLIRDKAEKCENAQTGLIVEGRGRGTGVLICAEPECQKHGFRHSSYSLNSRESAVRRRVMEKSRKNAEVAERALAAILQKVKTPLPISDLRMVTLEYFYSVWYELRRKIAKRNQVQPEVIRGTKRKDWEAGMKKHIAAQDEAGCQRLLVEMTLSRHMKPEYDGRTSLLMETAKRFRVNVKRITASVDEEFAARKTRKQIVGKKAPKKTKKQPAK